MQVKIVQNFLYYYLALRPPCRDVIVLLGQFRPPLNVTLRGLNIMTQHNRLDFFSPTKHFRQVMQDNQHLSIGFVEAPPDETVRYNVTLKTDFLFETVLWVSQVETSYGKIYIIRHDGHEIGASQSYLQANAFCFQFLSQVQNNCHCDCPIVYPIDPSMIDDDSEYTLDELFN